MSATVDSRLRGNDKFAGLVCTHKVFFTHFNTVVAQDVIGRSRVEKEMLQRVGQQLSLIHI